MRIGVVTLLTVTGGPLIQSVVNAGPLGLGQTDDTADSRRIPMTFRYGCYSK